MRKLFDLDMQDYTSTERVLVRPSVRAVIIRDDKVCVIRSRKYTYYKYPGGGIDPGETHEEALCREVREEAGMVLKPETIRPFGNVHRVSRGVDEYESYDLFIQDNFYYLAEAEDTQVSQSLDEYEREEGFTAVFVYPEEIIEVNRTRDHGSADPAMIERETRVTEMLVQEGILRKSNACR